MAKKKMDVKKRINNTREVLLKQRKHIKSEIYRHKKIRENDKKYKVIVNDKKIDSMPLKYFLLSAVTIVSAMFSAIFGFLDNPLYTNFRLATPAMILSIVFGSIMLIGLVAQTFCLVRRKRPMSYHVVAFVFAAPIIFINIIGAFAIPMLMVSFVVSKRRTNKKVWIPIVSVLSLLVTPIVGFATLVTWGLVTTMSKNETKSFTIQEGSLANKQTVIKAGDSLSVVSWNIGYASTGSEMDYFYDKDYYGKSGTKGKSWKKSQVESHLAGIKQFLSVASGHGKTNKSGHGKTKIIRYIKDATKSDNVSVIEDKNGNIISGNNIFKDKIFSKPTDFIMLQEIDRPSVRSMYIDEVSQIAKIMPDYDAQFVNNLRVGVVPVPLLDPNGQVDAGQMTLSRYNVDSPRRVSLNSVGGGLDSIFNLKRAIGLTEYKTNVNRNSKVSTIATGKRVLHMANLHMSAFPEDAVKRNKEYKTLLGLISKWNQQDDYVVIGGDWNTDITDQYYYEKHKNDKNAANSFVNTKKFISDQSPPSLPFLGLSLRKIDQTSGLGGISLSELGQYDISKFTKDFRDGIEKITSVDGQKTKYKLGVDKDLTHPTMRLAGEKWYGYEGKQIKRSDYAIIDGFLVSGNVAISSTETLQQGWHKNNLNPEHPYAFADSDHNPVIMHFSLNK